MKILTAFFIILPFLSFSQTDTACWHNWLATDEAGREFSPVYSILKKSDGQYMLGTSFLGFFEFNPKNDSMKRDTSFSSPLFDVQIEEMEERNGAIYFIQGVANSNSLYKLENGVVSSIREAYKPFDILKVDKDIWVSDSRGLLRINENDEITKYTTDNSPLPTNYTRRIDHYQGNFWMTTSDGIVNFDGQNWTVWDTINSNLPRNDFWDVSIDEEGNPWFITRDLNEQLLYKFNGTDFVNFTDSIFISNWSLLYTLYVKNEQNIWIGGHRGLFTNVNGDWEKIENLGNVFQIKPEGELIWFCGGKRLWLYNPTCKSLSFATSAPEIPELKLFPNPTNGVLNFSNLQIPNQVTIYRVTGKKIFYKKNVVETVNLEGLPSGGYIIELEHSGYRISKKIIID